jgi:gluconokinase
MILILMGVVGAGKTLIGSLLANELGWKFADADDFHSVASLDKIRHGISLNDADRAPWLMRLREEITNWNRSNTNAVLACSALKERYRQELAVGPEVKVVYLKGSPELIAARLRSRKGHFANEQILPGQFADLEEPQAATIVDIAQPPADIVAEIRSKLRLA